MCANAAGDENSRFLSSSVTRSAARAAAAPANLSPDPVVDASSDDGSPSWTAFLSVTFDFDDSRLRDSDREKAGRAATYLAANPSSRIGLDGRSDPNGNGLRNKELMERRVAAVRNALIQAGVPGNKIETGDFADLRPIRDREVAAVLITPKAP